MRIKVYIGASLSGGTPVDKIAEACGLSVDALCSGFLSTTCFGMDCVISNEQSPIATEQSR